MKSNSLIGILSITGLFLITLCACNSSAKKEDKPMNVIYIMADDHAYQAVSAYGSQLGKLAPTPNIDRIANEGAMEWIMFIALTLYAAQAELLF